MLCGLCEAGIGAPLFPFRFFRGLCGRDSTHFVLVELDKRVVNKAMYIYKIGYICR